MNKIVKDTLSITVITLVAGLALGIVQDITAGPIARQAELAKQEAAQAEAARQQQQAALNSEEEDLVVREERLAATLCGKDAEVEKVAHAVQTINVFMENAAVKAENKADATVKGTSKKVVTVEENVHNRMNFIMGKISYVNTTCSFESSNGTTC